MKTVLVADDSKIIRDLLEKILTNMFFKVFVAEDGEEALSIFEKNDIEVVILDCNLPVLDGFSVLHKIKEQNKSDAKIIFCSTTNSLDVIKKAINLGIDDYIIKPFDEDVIASKLKILGVL